MSHIWRHTQDNTHDPVQATQPIPRQHHPLQQWLAHFYTIHPVDSDQVRQWIEVSCADYDVEVNQDDVEVNQDDVEVKTRI